MADHERIATALWIAHAHVFSKFMITPRLALTSPVRGCGKTTLLKIIERMTPRARRMDGVSAAAIYRLVDREHSTLLVDEADNLGLLHRWPHAGQRSTAAMPRADDSCAPTATASVNGQPSRPWPSPRSVSCRCPYRIAPSPYT